MYDIDRAYEQIGTGLRELEDYINTFYDECVWLADDIVKAAIKGITCQLNEELKDIVHDDFQGLLTATQFIAYRLDRGWSLDEISPYLQGKIDAIVEQYLDTMPEEKRLVLRYGAGQCGEVLTDEEIVRLLSDRISENFAELASNLPTLEGRTREFFFKYEDQRLSLPTKKLMVANKDELMSDICRYLTDLWLEDDGVDRLVEFDSAVEYARRFTHWAAFSYHKEDILSADWDVARALMSNILNELEEVLMPLFSDVQFPLQSTFVDPEEIDEASWIEVILGMMPTSHDY